jgi:hypothetical protein
MPFEVVAGKENGGTGEKKTAEPGTGNPEPGKAKN